MGRVTEVSDIARHAVGMAGAVGFGGHEVLVSDTWTEYVPRDVFLAMGVSGHPDTGFHIPHVTFCMSTTRLTEERAEPFGLLVRPQPGSLLVVAAPVISSGFAEVVRGRLPGVRLVEYTSYGQIVFASEERGDVPCDPVFTEVFV